MIHGLDAEKNVEAAGVQYMTVGLVDNDKSHTLLL